MATELRTRSLVVLGLSSLAVAQPLLDLFGRNPEFFVAGNYSTGQIVWFALLITLVPPLVGIAAIAIATLINRRAGTIVYAIVVALLGAAFVLAVLRTIGVDPVVLVVARRLGRWGRPPSPWPCERMPGDCCCPTSPSPTSPSSRCSCSPARPPKLIAGGGSGDLGEVTVPELGGPVVVLVLDEFPAATIMRPDGTINSDRFPGFAELASVSTWFRNASSQHNLTHRAVPSILDGRLAADGTLPTYSDHPRNLFTLFGGDSPGAQLRVGDVAVPAGPLCRDGPAPADAGARGRLDRVRPSAPSRRAARRLAADRQLVGRLRRPGGRRWRRQLHPRRLLALARARCRRAQPARPGRRAQRAHAGDHRRTGAALRPRRRAAPAVGAVTERVRHVVRPGADPRHERPRLRVREPHGVPAAQPAGRRRRHVDRRAARPAPRTAELGADAARRHVRPRLQPDPARPRTNAHHRGESRGGVPRAAVRQGAGTDRRARSATTAPR